MRVELSKAEAESIVEALRTAASTLETGQFLHAESGRSIARLDDARRLLFERMLAAQYPSMRRDAMQASMALASSNR